jgi:hypothetical protein
MRRSRRNPTLTALALGAMVVAGASIGLTLLAVRAPAEGAETSSARGCTAPATFDAARGRSNVSVAEIYAYSCRIARLVGPRATARTYRVRSANPRAICRGYARASYGRGFLPPALNGCLRGFSLRR